MSGAGQVPLGALAAVGADRPPLMVTMRDDGRVEVTCPVAPSWAATASTTHELALALRDGWTEAAIAQYAARHDEVYDRAAHDQLAAAEAVQGRQVPADAEPVTMTLVSRPETSTGARASTSTHDPLAWHELDDGRMVSPSGRTYGAETQAARQVRAKQAAMGLGVAG